MNLKEKPRRATSIMTQRNSSTMKDEGMRSIKKKMRMMISITRLMRTMMKKMMKQ